MADVRAGSALPTCRSRLGASPSAYTSSPVLAPKAPPPSVMFDGHRTIAVATDIGGGPIEPDRSGRAEPSPGRPRQLVTTRRRPTATARLRPRDNSAGRTHPARLPVCHLMRKAWYGSRVTGGRRWPSAGPGHHGRLPPAGGAAEVPRRSEEFGKMRARISGDRGEAAGLAVCGGGSGKGGWCPWRRMRAALRSLPREPGERGEALRPP